MSDNVKSVQGGTVSTSVEQMASSADGLSQALQDLYDSMANVSNKAESDTIKNFAESIKTYVGENKESIVGNIKNEGARIAMVTEEIIKEDQREL